MRERMAALGFVLGLAYRATPAAFVLGLVLESAGFVATVLLGLWFKRAADGVAAADLRQALAAALGFAGTVAALMALQITGAHLRLAADDELRLRLEERLARLAASDPGLGLFERPELLDRIELIRNRQEEIGRAAGAVILAAANLARWVAATVLLAGVEPLLAALPLTGLASAAAADAGRRLVQDAEEQAAEPRRLAEHLQQAALGAGPAKEVRIFGLEEELRKRYEAAAGAAGAALDRAHLRAARLRWAADALPRLTLAASAAWVAWHGSRGAATPGDVLLVLHVGWYAAAHVTEATRALGGLLRVLRVAEHFLWLERHVRTSLAPAADPLPPPARLERGIRLERVSFRYPGTERWVLRDVDLELPAGAVVAVVGENGAGKTTLVKLLLRLYEPTAGRIQVDGVDLSRIPVEAWRRRCTAAFQDFVRLEVVARESVGVGDLSRSGEDAAVMAALVRAGAEDMPDQLPHGLDTLLGRTWGGVDLSGGQWQKLAVARAMMREEPVLVVLDEPAAALDAETEYALYQRYAEAARAGRGRGAVTLLVSHRFTTVRMADVIVVLEDGRVVEAGDHETLMAAGGLYAQLYQLQARAYRDR